MADDIRETIHELLDEGYTADEIRQALRQEGYNTAVIDRVLNEEMSNGSDTGKYNRLWTVQQYSWLVAFGIVLISYTVIALWPWQMADVLQPVDRVITGVVGIVFGLQTFAGIYWAVKKHLYRAAVSLGGVLAAGSAFGAVGFLAMQAFTDMAAMFGGSTGFESGAAVLGPIPVLLNAGILAMGVVAAVFLYGRFGHAAVVFPLLFLAVFGGIWGMQYVQLTGAADMIERPPFRTPMFAEIDGSAQILRGAAMTPPPFTKLMASFTVVADTAGTYSWWQSVRASARKDGYGDTPLRGPGEVCGGTLANIDEQYKSTIPSTLARFKVYTVTAVEANTDAAIAGLARRCAANRDCDANRSAIRADLEQFISWQKTRIETYQGLFDVSLQDTPRPVDDCSPPPAQYYGVRLQNISCSTPFTMKLSSTGTRPMSTPVKVYVNDKDGDLVATTTVASVRNWADGTKTLSTDTLFDGMSSADGFASGEPYEVEVAFADTGVAFYTYCVGGNGFCKNCHTAQRSSEYGYNKTVLVR